MATNMELAVLAYAAYEASDNNSIGMSTWDEAESLRRDTIDGFSARVYAKGDEVVIAFRGSDGWWKLRDMATANFPAAAGVYSSQVMNAIKLVADVMAEYPDADISFTGHSLGGGLASLMAVFFERPATIFNPAPFGNTAQSTELWRYFDGYLSYQRQQGRPLAQDDKFKEFWSSHAANDPTLYQQRLTQVSGVFLEGEALIALRDSLPTVVGPTGLVPVDIGLTTMNDDAIDLLGGEEATLHSMNLLIAMMASPDLQAVSAQLPRLLGLLTNEDFFWHESSDVERNIVTWLTRDQVIDGESVAGGALDKFVWDLEKLTGEHGVAQSIPALQDALIVAAMEYHYFNDPATSWQLFSEEGGGIHFNFNSIDSDALHSRGLLAAAAAPLLPVGFDWIGQRLGGQDAWHIQTGQGNFQWSAGGSENFDDVALGGQGNDSFSGGAGSDILIGGAGADILEGGASGDFLIGGAGADTYRFSGSWSEDVIVDDGSGDIIKVGGVTITGAGAKQVGAGLWRDDVANITYTVRLGDNGQQVLMIVVSGADAGRIFIYNWTENAFGISFGSEPVEPPAASNELFGDIIKAVDGDDYVLTPNGYASAGTQAGAQDVFNGNTGDDNIYGYGGNDGLAGGDGDDWIEGGDGSDLILGGFGTDTLIGGEGDDRIYGSASGTIECPTSTNFTPPASSGIELARGFSWVIFNPPGVDANGNDVVVTAGVSDTLPNGELTGNDIDGGGGNDTILAGTGEDTVDGGADDDTIWGMGMGDILHGGSGADTIHGDGSILPWAYSDYTPLSEHGADWISGGTGNDILVGQGGADHLFGDEDDDELSGDESNLANTPASAHGNDFLDGGSGNDDLWGNGGSDILIGGSGDDELVGDYPGLDAQFTGDDHLDGGDGNDFLSGDGGSDILYGGSGNDFLQGDAADTTLADSGNDFLDGGSGNDTLIGAAGSDALYGGDDDDQLHGDSASTPSASQGNDYLDGGAGADILNGYGGDDFLVGGSGVDELYGSEGNDTLAGGTGQDVLQGGAGDDTYVFAVGDATILNGTGDTISDMEGLSTIELRDVASDEITMGLTLGGTAHSLIFGNAEGIAIGIGTNARLELADGTWTLAELYGRRASGVIAYQVEGQLWQLGGFGADSLTSVGATTLSGGEGDDTLTGTGGNNAYPDRQCRQRHVSVQSG